MNRWALLLALLAGCQAPVASVSLEGSTLALSPGPHGYSLGQFARSLLALPPPPGSSLPWSRTTPAQPADYSALLALLRSGPGGYVITLPALESLAPALLSLRPLSRQQALASPVPWQLRAQFPSLWNQSYGRFLWQNRLQLEDLLAALLSQLQAAPVTLSGVNTASAPDPVAGLLEVLGRGDPMEIAELAPTLASAALGAQATLVLYAAKDGWKPALVVPSSPGPGKTLSVNPGGAYVSELGAGGPIPWQGRLDRSLVYLPVEVRNGSVETLDVIASERFRWLRRAAGGSELERTRPSGGAILSAGLALGGLHGRVVAGATAHESLGGAVVEIRSTPEPFRVTIHRAARPAERSCGSGPTDPEYLGARIALGLFASRDPLAFADLEAWARTPPVRHEGEGGEASAWISLHGSASGSIEEGERELLWQGDLRLTPRAHVALSLGELQLELALGAQLGLVPGGRADPARQLRSLGLHKVRWVVESAATLGALRAGGLLEVSRYRVGVRVELAYGPFSVLGLLDGEASWAGAAFRGPRGGEAGLPPCPVEVEVLRSLGEAGWSARAGVRWAW